MYLKRRVCFANLCRRILLQPELHWTVSSVRPPRQTRGLFSCCSGRRSPWCPYFVRRDRYNLRRIVRWTQRERLRLRASRNNLHSYELCNGFRVPSYLQLLGGGRLRREAQSHLRPLQMQLNLRHLPHHLRNQRRLLDRQPMQQSNAPVRVVRRSGERVQHCLRLQSGTQLC